MYGSNWRASERTQRFRVLAWQAWDLSIDPMYHKHLLSSIWPVPSSPAYLSTNHYLALARDQVLSGASKILPENLWGGLKE